MSVKVIFAFDHCTPRSDRKPTIWEALAERLNREPSRLEAADEVRRILSEAAEDYSGDTKPMRKAKARRKEATR